MQENVLPGGQKYTKVEEKLELLAQSKLRNLAQTNLKALEDRTAHLEKALAEQIVVAERNGKSGVTQIGSAGRDCASCRRRCCRSNKNVAGPWH